MPGAGALRRIAFDICSAGAANGLDPDEVIADILPHPLSMVQKLLPSAELVALDWACVRSAPGEWLVSAPIAGAVLVMQLSMNGRPTRFMTRVTADSGTMELDNFHDFAVLWPGKVSRGTKIVQPFQRSGLGLLAAGMNLAARAARAELGAICGDGARRGVASWRRIELPALTPTATTAAPAATFAATLPPSSPGLSALTSELSPNLRLLASPAR